MNVIIAGVGGQGTVLASRAIAQAAVTAGIEAITSETIGMAQREGVVQSHVRLAVGEVGPLIPAGAADLLIGFEPAEAVRALPRVRPGAGAVVNTAVVYPFTVALGTSHYDTKAILAYLHHCLPGTQMLDATGLAVEAGGRRAMNAVMLGAVAGLDLLPIPADAILQALLGLVRQSFRELNRRAFELGGEAVRKAGTA